MGIRKLALFFSFALLTCALFAASFAPIAAEVMSTGPQELLLESEQSIIIGENYTYYLTLVNLDPCDKLLSNDFTCVPSITVDVMQIDNITNEVLQTTSLEHLRFGYQDVDIQYDDITIVSLNVLNIAFFENKAKVEIGYTSTATVADSIEITSKDDNINAVLGYNNSTIIYINNSSKNDIEVFFSVKSAASSPVLTIKWGGSEQKIKTGDERLLVLHQGNNTLTLSFVPREEGHQVLSFFVKVDDKTIEMVLPVLVHPAEDISSDVIFANRASFDDVLNDQKIVGDVKMDSVYLLGFSFILLVIGGVLGFVHTSNGGSFVSMDKEK